MEKIEHTTVPTNGINMHVASIGAGPPVLFLHGFPELWYSWRHQLLSLSSLGYRCIAPDLRGFGDTDAPPSPTSYTAMHIVGDLIGLLDHLGIDQVFLVAHDWGAVMAWWFCLFRPDRVKALVNMSVALSPRNPKTKPVDGFRALFGDDYYICRFQDEPGATERLLIKVTGANRENSLFAVQSKVGLLMIDVAPDFLKEGNLVGLGHLYSEPGEIEQDFDSTGTAAVMKRFLTGRSPKPLCIPKDQGIKSFPAPVTLPAWLTEEDLNYFVSKFSKSGFTGGLNYYRALNLTWELTGPWTGLQIKVPVKFIVGELDITYHIPGVQAYIHKGGFKRDVPFLQEVVVMEDTAHFLNQEKPDEISQHVYDFIKRF